MKHLFTKQFTLRVLGVMLRPVQFAIFALSGLAPRDLDTWVFGTWGGKRFADNSAALFRHLNDHPTHGIRTVWITRRREIRDDLRREGMSAHMAWSPGGIWWSLRGGVYVYDSVVNDINFWLSRGARRALLQHGIGMKKIERAIDATDHRLHKLFHGQPHERLLWRLALPWHLADPHVAIACSPNHVGQTLQFFDIDVDDVRVTGMPRHDRLADDGAGTHTAIPTVGAEIPTERPVFLYLPTFREGAAQQSFDWSVLQAAAEAADVTIATKLHVVDAERGVRGMEALTDASHLRLVDPDVDPIDIYARADGLITDFSSAAYDVLLMDRPVIHYVPDLDDFVAQRPLIAPFEELAVGPICRDASSLATALRAGADPTDETTVERRHRVRERCFTFPPGGASERVIDAIRDAVG